MTRGRPAVQRSETVVVELRNRILKGTYPAGFHLQEIPLAQSLGVSRTPIREALTTLAHEGLLAPGPKRGYQIRTFTIDEVIDAYEVRATLEGLAARVVAERGLSPAARASLEAVLREGDRLLARGLDRRDQVAWLEMNNSFHTGLVDATRNGMLQSFIEQSHRVPLASARHVHWYKFDAENFALARRAHDDHHAVFTAIAEGKAVRAESLMREHIYFSQRLVAEHVRERLVGFDTQPGGGEAAAEAERPRAPRPRRRAAG